MDKDLRKCKGCGVTKSRILDGRFPNLMKRFIDETGRLWNGSTCPECNNKRVKEKMRKVRSL